MPEWLESTCTAAGAAVLSLWFLLVAACGLAGVRSRVRCWRSGRDVVAGAERLTREAAR